MKKAAPKLTERILQGLTDAFSAHEADDNLDRTDQEVAEMEAAGKWLEKAWLWWFTRNDKPAKEGRK